MNSNDKTSEYATIKKNLYKPKLSTEADEY